MLMSKLSDNGVRDYSLDILRIFAILGVVAIHVFGYLIDGETNTVAWWGGLAISRFFTWAVPIFIMISGALTLRAVSHTQGPFVFYKKRINRLLPALVAWHIIYVVGIRVIIEGERFFSSSTLVSLLDGRAYTALYFLWIILGLYMVAPVLAAFLNKNNQRVALISGVVVSLWAICVIKLPEVYEALGYQRSFSLNVFTYFIPFIGYYILGFALYKVKISYTIKWLLILFSIIFLISEILSFAYLFREHNLGFFAYINPPGAFSVGMIFTTSSIFLIFRNSKIFQNIPENVKGIIARLSEACFGVFLVHLLLVFFILRFIPLKLLQGSLMVSTFVYLVTIVTSFLLVILLTKIPFLRRIVI